MQTSVKTTTNYYKRQLDIECLQSMVTPSTEYQELTPSASKNQTKAVSGIQKLVQRYVVLFTTLTGSDVFNKYIGTNLVDVCSRGNVPGLSYVDLMANTANFKTQDKIKHDDESNAARYGDQPDDEKLQESRIVDVTLDTVTRTIRIHVSIRSVAGDSVTFVVPTTYGVFK